MNNIIVGSTPRAGWKRLATTALAATALLTANLRAADSFTVASFVGGGVSLDTLDAITGTDARFLNPTSTAVDAAGNLYVADGGDHTIRKITTAGVVTTFAGASGEAGSVNGTGSDARFVYPFGIAVGGDNNIYVTDIGDHTVRKITMAGVVTTLAGAPGVAGSADGAGAAASFNLPQGIAVGPGSNYYVYVADNANSTIRRIDSSGNVITFAGSAGVTGHVNGIPSVARFNYPVGITVDTVGNIYVADFGNNAIRKLDTGGTTSTLAGDLLSNAGHVDGTGVFARFDHPSAVAVAGATGDVYVADTSNHVIRKINTSSVVSTISGSPGTLGSADGTAAARFFYPSGISVNSAGTRILVVDTGSHSIRSLDNSVSPVNTTTFAGATGSVGTTDGTGSSIRFKYPNGVAVDAAGNVYVADHDNHTIRKISALGISSTLAGTAGVSGSADGIGIAATFKGPTGVAVDTAGNVYVSDTDNNTIRKITAAGVVTTFASGVFGEPRGIAVDATGNVYVANTLRHVINKITPAGTVTVYAGTETQSGSADGAATTAARFNRPYAVAVDSAGIVYVGDFGNHTVRKIAVDGTVSTIAGTAEVSGKADGVGAAARFNQINGIAVNSGGIIYVTDTYNRVVRAINGTTVTTLNGVGTRFYYPQGIAVDTIGNLYISDGDNQAITKASIILGPPVGGSSVGTQVVTVGQAATFSVAGQTGATYQWQVSTNGTTWTDVTNDATYSDATTSTLTISNTTVALTGNLYRVQLTRSATTVASATGTLTVNLAPPGGGSSIASQSVTAGANAVFSSGAAQSGISYQWQVSTDGTTWNDVANDATYSGATSNNLTITGTTTAMTGQKYRVKLTNTGGSSFSGSATLTVTAATPSASGARLINLSIRSDVGLGANAVFIGLNISGTGSKNMIIRGIGPGLVPHGITSGFLVNPELKLFSGNTNIASNVRWGTAPNASTMAASFSSVGAFAIADGSTDSAIVQPLNTGSYSAQVTGVGDTTGVTLAEFYDGDGSSFTTRLTNASARARVGTGSSTLTAGFVVVGQGAVKVLIRGVGPSLIPHGITTGYVSKPKITVFKLQTEIASNSGWDGSAGMIETFTKVGAFGYTSTLDTALVLELTEGNYSVQLTNSDGTGGIGLVEVYEIP